MIMGFYLEAQIPIVIESDDPCVIHEGRTDPRSVDLLRCLADHGLEQTVDDLDFAIRSIRIFDNRFEGLVYAMFRPCLRQRFEFHISWRATCCAEVRLNSAYLVNAQR